MKHYPRCLECKTKLGNNECQCDGPWSPVHDYDYCEACATILLDDPHSLGNYNDELHDEVVTGEYWRNRTRNIEFSKDYDWSKHDFDNDPDWY